MRNFNCLLFLIILFLSLNIPGISIAQLSAYTFEQKQLDYPIDFTGYSLKNLSIPESTSKPQKYLFNGDTIGSTQTSLTGLGFPIGFDFKFDNEVFDRVAVSSNGYIKLGKSGEPFTIINDTVAGNIFKNGLNNERCNVISLLQGSLSAFNNHLIFVRIVTSGLPGRRIFIVEFGRFALIGNGVGTNLIRLFEGSNKIEFVYNWNVYESGDTRIAVGLRGNKLTENRENILIRKVTDGSNPWYNSQTSVSSDSLSILGINNCPKRILYSWTPPISNEPPTCGVPYLFIDKNHPGSLYHDENYFVLADNATNIPINSVLYWGKPYGEPSVFDVYFGTDNPPINLVSKNQSDTTYNPGELAPNIDYYYNIVPKNKYGTSPSCIQRFTTGKLLNYCDPDRRGTYYVKKFKINSLSYDYSREIENEYIFPQIPPYTTALKRKEAYQITTLANTLPFDSGFDLLIYIDFNRNGKFDDPGEFKDLGWFAENETHLDTITIPENAMLGTTLMRLVIRGGGDFTPKSPCNFSTASRIDFIVTIDPSSECENFVVSPTLKHLACFKDNSGIIDLNVSGGTKPYSILWKDNESVTEERINLSSGLYSASVSDATGCDIKTSVLALLQPASLLLDTIITYADGKGNIDLSISGGTSPYSYTWSDGQIIEDLVNVVSGLYSVNIIDANNCKTSLDSIEVHASTGLKNISRVNDDIKIYPNPAEEILHISLKENNIGSSYQIISIDGTIKQKGPLSEAENTIDIVPLKSGIFVLRILRNENSVNHIFLKN